MLLFCLDLNNLDKKFIPMTTGYTRYNISQKDILSIQLQIPTLNEQKK